MEILKDIKTKVKSSTIWAITLPIILGNLAQTLIVLTDTAFLGRLGEVELGAASMAGIYYFCFTTLAWGFAIGEQIIIARRLGEKRYDAIGGVLLNGLIFIMPIACLLFSVLYYVSPIFLSHSLSSENVYNVATEFLSYRAFGIFFACINYMFRSFYIGLSKTRSIGVSTILMALVNITLDYLLIFGSAFNEPMGVKGAAIASVCAEVSATIFFILYTAFTKPIKGHPVFRNFKFDTTILKSIFSLSVPTMMQKMISFGSWLVFFFFIEKMGERALAVTMVARNAFMIIVMPAFAFGATSNTLTSRLIGERRFNEVRSTIFKIVKISISMITIIIALVLLFPNVWLGVYTDNISLIEETKPILFLLCFVAYLYAVSSVYFEATSGTGYTKKALYMESLALASYLFAAWLFAIKMECSLIIVWTSEILYGSILAISCYLFMRYYKWQYRKV